MVFVVLLIDQLFWKPLVTIADRSKLELSAGEHQHFWLVDLWQSARLPGYVEIAVGPVTRALDRWFSRLTRVSPSKEAVKTAATGDTVFNVIVLVITAGLLVAAIGFVLSGVGIEEVLHAAVLGLATGGRVLALITFSTLVWTPIGVVIGFNPKLARLSQPLVQILASFPANFRFPFATLAFIRLGVSQRRCSSMGTSLSPIDR